MGVMKWNTICTRTISRMLMYVRVMLLYKVLRDFVDVARTRV